MTLLDSNIIIYAAQPEHSRLRQFIRENAPCVSAVSSVEVLGYSRLSGDERRHFEAFFVAATILPISDAATWNVPSSLPQKGPCDLERDGASARRGDGATRQTLLS